MNKTKYRIVNYNGHWDVLEYWGKYNTFLWLTAEKWFPVPKPYYHKFYGRSLDVCGDNTTITSLHENLKEFIEKWPDIEEYFKFYSQEQQKLVDKAKKYHSDLESKKGVKGIY